MGSFGFRALTMAAVVGATTLGTAGLAVAQDATPMAGMEQAAAFPNHIHEGTCDNLNPEPVFPLADLAFESAEASMGSAMATPMAGMGMMGEGIPVAVATTEVPATLDAIVSGGSAINVHDSADISRYIACGSIVGTPDDNGNLFVGLGELNDSGYDGVAWLLGDGDATTVTVFLVQDDGEMIGGDMDVDDEGDMMATPEA